MIMLWIVNFVNDFMLLSIFLKYFMIKIHSNWIWYSLKISILVDPLYRKNQQL